MVTSRLQMVFARLYQYSNNVMFYIRKAITPCVTGVQIVKSRDRNYSPDKHEGIFFTIISFKNESPTKSIQTKIAYELQGNLYVDAINIYTLLVFFIESQNEKKIFKEEVRFYTFGQFLFSCFLLMNIL